MFNVFENNWNIFVFDDWDETCWRTCNSGVNAKKPKEKRKNIIINGFRYSNELLQTNERITASIHLRSEKKKRQRAVRSLCCSSDRTYNNQQSHSKDPPQPNLTISTFISIQKLGNQLTFRNWDKFKQKKNRKNLLNFRVSINRIVERFMHSFFFKWNLITVTINGKSFFKFNNNNNNKPKVSAKIWMKKKEEENKKKKRKGNVCSVWICNIKFFWSFF